MLDVSALDIYWSIQSINIGELKCSLREWHYDESGGIWY